jgi:hypothetical protein
MILPGMIGQSQLRAGMKSALIILSCLFASRFLCVRAYRLCIPNEHWWGAFSVLCLAGVVLHWHMIDRYMVSLCLASICFLLCFALLVSATLTWLVAWLSCLPCRTWCNIIIMSLYLLKACNVIPRHAIEAVLPPLNNDIPRGHYFHIRLSHQCNIIIIISAQSDNSELLNEHCCTTSEKSWRTQAVLGQKCLIFVIHQTR